MPAIFLALSPVFCILMAGLGLKKSQFLAETFWRNLEKLTYWALLPALFLKTMAEADFSGLNVFTIMLAGSSLLIIMVALLFVVRPLTPTIDGPSYSSVIQGATRFNNYVALPVTVSLFGEEGVVVYAIVMSVMIPLTNITSVWALSHYASHEHMNWRRLGRHIVTNPFIVSTLMGVLLSITHIGLPPVIHEVVSAFADASLLMGLLAIGASLDLGAAKSNYKLTLYSAVLKLVVYPAIALLLTQLFTLDATTFGVLLLFASLPTATSSYLLASQLGGNATLMANIVATETLLAFLTMPFWLWLALHY